MVVAPAAIVPHNGCGIGNRDINNVASFSKPAIVSFDINIMAHVARISNCKIDPFSLFLINVNVSSCGFLTTDNYKYVLITY